MVLKLTNNLSKSEMELIDLEDKKDSALLYAFDISLPVGMSDGEYTYQLYDGVKKLSEGLLQVGDHVQEKKEYNEKKNIFVYEG